MPFTVQIPADFSFCVDLIRFVDYQYILGYTGENIEYLDVGDIDTVLLERVDVHDVEIFYLIGILTR